MTGTLPSQRELFDIPEDVAYLNCAYLSPFMKRVTDAGKAAVTRKARPWEITPPDFFTDADRARALFARLVNGDAAGVAITPSVSYGIALAARNLPIAPGKKVLILEDQFPSNVYEWHDAAARAGGSVKVVARPRDYDWTSAVLERVDENTAIVALPNCHWTDGTVVDLVSVGEAARSVGAALVVDVIQSLGARPFDIRAVRPDWLLTATHKWMLGPFALGFCWVAPEGRDGVPLERNWITRAGAEDFSRLVDYTDEFARGATRYDMGHRSNFIALPIAMEAMEQILEWGVERIEERIGELNDALVGEAESLGWEIAPPAARSRHMVGLRRPGGVPREVTGRLKDAGVYVSVRGDSMRVSPHVYNTDEDVARLLEALAG